MTARELCHYGRSCNAIAFADTQLSWGTGLPRELAATMPARRMAAASDGATVVEAAITFRLGEVRSALWTRLLDEHIAGLEAEADRSWLPRYRAMQRQVEGLRARLERVLATVPCLETSSLREDFERLVLAPSSEVQP